MLVDTMLGVVVAVYGNPVMYSVLKNPCQYSQYRVYIEDIEDIEKY
jgi:hypothetical protein